MRCINLIYTEGANFIMMTRQLGNNTVKEKKSQITLGNEGVQQKTVGLNVFRFDQLVGKNKTGLP